MHTITPLDKPSWDIRLQAVIYIVESSKHGRVMAVVDTSDLDFKDQDDAVAEFNLHESEIMRAITGALENDEGIDHDVPQGEPPRLRISAC